MAITDAQRSDALFKAALGVANSEPTKPFFEQPLPAKPVIFSHYIWSQANLIPQTAPSLNDQEIQGILRYNEQVELEQVSGSQAAFTAARLKNVVPFNFGDGSYNYVITANGEPVVFGRNDWVLQNDVLVFYGGLSGLALPIKISFYEYIGSLGAVDISTVLDALDNLEVFGEIVSPAKTFSSLFQFRLNSLRVYLNGIRLRHEADYAVAGNEITLVDEHAEDLDSNDIILLDYKRL